MSTPLHKICELTEQLHRAMDDEAKADIIRDAMESYWYQLDENEQRWARVLSAGFNVISKTS